MSNFVLNIVVTCCLLVSFSFSYETKLQIFQVSFPEPGNGPKSLESPQWSVEENALYWVSNLGTKRLFRMDGDTREITNRTVCGAQFLIVPVRDYPGYVVVGSQSSLYLLNWNAKDEQSALRLLTTVDMGKPDNRINDGKADAKGRLFFGTMGKFNLEHPKASDIPRDQAAFYSITSSSFVQPTVQKKPVSVSNGIAWTRDNKKMYYNDSPTRKVVAFDYDLEKGTIANETMGFSMDDYNIKGIVDGMTIDEDGNLWVATVTPLILHIDPRTGTLIQTIEVPVDQVTSVMWGGRNLDKLYVATAALNKKNPRKLSGSMLVIEGLGTRGVPEYQFVFPDAPNY